MLVLESAELREELVAICLFERENLLVYVAWYVSDQEMCAISVSEHLLCFIKTILTKYN